MGAKCWFTQKSEERRQNPIWCRAFGRRQVKGKAFPYAWATAIRVYSQHDQLSYPTVLKDPNISSKDSYVSHHRRQSNQRTVMIVAAVLVILMLLKIVRM